MATGLTTTARSPAPLNLEDPVHRGENWKKFERDWKFFALATKLAKEDNDVRCATLLNVIGDDGLDLYETFAFENDDDKDDIKKILEKFRNFCVPTLDPTFEKYVFNSRDQQEGESLNAYIIAVTKLARTCDFADAKDDHIRDRLVQGIRSSSLRQKLFDKSPMNLEKCLKILRTSEVNRYRAQCNDVCRSAVLDRLITYVQTRANNYNTNINYCSSHPPLFNYTVSSTWLS
eukprot:m.291111 g.291111  ORF g.291111 m.291111 type:complete len:232 (+) comp40724_c2_seq1:1251-1946(+)